MLTMRQKNRPNNFHYLLHSAALIEKSLATKLAPLGLGPRQARVIDALDRMGPSSQVNLARECGITAASMSTMTSRLITAGYINCVTDAVEARRNTLSLSSRGLDLLNDIKKTWNEVDDDIKKLIGAEKTKSLTNLARELRNELGGNTPGANQQQKTK